MNSAYRKPDQIIEPYFFGENAKKSTCLWLKNLPPLFPTNMVWVKYVTLKNGRTFSEWEYKISSNKKERSKLRSKTFPGIAEAMASQWGEYLSNLY